MRQRREIAFLAALVLLVAGVAVARHGERPTLLDQYEDEVEVVQDVVVVPSTSRVTTSTSVDATPVTTVVVVATTAERSGVVAAPIPTAAQTSISPTVPSTTLAATTTRGTSPTTSTSATTTTTLAATTTRAVTTTAAPTTTTVSLPAPPNGLVGRVLVWHNTLAPELSTEQVLLTWADNATNETEYRVYEDYRSCAYRGAPTVLLATFPADATRGIVYNARGFVQRYCAPWLYVVAANGAGESTPSEGFMLHAPLPNAPVIQTYAAFSPTEAHLTWRHTAVDGFETRLFTLTDSLGGPLMPLNNIGPPFGEYYPPVTKTVLSSSSTATVYQYDVNVSRYSCVRIRATNSYQHAYDYTNSTLSSGCIALS